MSVRHVYHISKLDGGFNPSEKYESQLGSLFQTEWKDKIHVPNHQPVLVHEGHLVTHLTVLLFFGKSYPKHGSHQNMSCSMGYIPTISNPKTWICLRKPRESKTYSLNQNPHI
jgi:hypothetical protein